MENCKLYVRAFVLTVLPFAVFGALYFILGLYPNYNMGHIDTAGVYGLEKQLFGITTAEGVLTPNEYFARHNWPLMDALSGVLYMCWVPLPILYTLWLFFRGRRTVAMHVSCAFLMVNLVGFAGYYIHPAAPPWYVMEHGFEPLFDTGGSAAGFSRFDALFGTTFFHDFYVNNQNVFAAIPSLHSAYNPVALWYAWRERDKWWTVLLAVVSVGIWFTAVYTAHHYIIDVTLGVLCTVVGVWLFERVVMRLKCTRKWRVQVKNMLNYEVFGKN